MSLKLEFVLQDMWIGVYWRPKHIWVCLLPCFPVHIQW